uniref:Uncharacterized protein n=1 Tax=Tetranychus urticae TaxID=32264 RepID=T1KLR3_TETUR
MMFNQVQLNSEQIDYDVPPSTCGYPIYFSLCVDGRFDKPNDSILSLKSSSSTLPNQNSRYGYNNSEINRYNTLTLGSNEENNNSKQNVLIPNREYNFTELLRLSEQPDMSNSTEVYDVPQPHNRYTHCSTISSNTNPVIQPSSKPSDIYPANENNDPSRPTLTRINCSPLPSRHIGQFGSTTSLPSPISNVPSLETSSVSYSSCDNNNSNRSSLLGQSSLEIYDVPPIRDFPHQTDQDNGCCSSCGSSTLNGLASGSLRKIGHTVDNLNSSHDAQISTSSSIDDDNQVIYDVPKRSLSWNNKHISSSQAINPVKAITATTRSYPCYNNSSSVQDIDSLGLDLNLDSGLTLANRLENESLQAINKLIELSSKDSWRKLENLRPVLDELMKCCSQLRFVTRELEVFTDGLYVNSLKNSSSSINNKLYRLSRQLKDSAHIVISTIQSLNSRGWNLNELTELKKTSHDELDQLIACMPGLKEDIKHIMSIVKSCGNLLFPEKVNKQPTLNKINKSNITLSNNGPVSSCKSKFESVETLPNKPLPPPVPPKPLINKRLLPLAPKDNHATSRNKVDSNLGKSFLSGETRTSKAKEDGIGNYDNDDNDEDYASLETRDKMMFGENKSCNDLYTELIDCKDEKESDLGQDELIDLSTDQLLSFYCPLLEENNQNLRNAVNALISAINTKQLPKVLINLSKLVVIAGQQMIFIGDTISRNVSGEIRCYVAKCSNALCDSLKNLLNNTKKAANLFPSAPALQDLLDSIVQVSIHSDQLTLLKDQLR